MVQSPAMPADIAPEGIPDQPQHPLDQLTTSELARYRRELEHALKVLPGTALVRELLDKHLKQALAEQESRRRIREANGST